MKVLYVVGACLQKNTSANMSHNAYIQGLLDNECDVDIIMSKDSWGENDDVLKKFDNVTYYEYSSTSFADKLRKIYKKTEKQKLNNPVFTKKNENQFVLKEKKSFRDVIKKFFYIIFPNDPIYPLQYKWLKEAKKFKSSNQYDLVISNSSPSASHKLVILLKDKIKYKRWVQIWEDPWYYDLYGNSTEQIREEEHNILIKGSEIIYVSPLTLYYQKKFFSDCAYKMKWIPLPYFNLQNSNYNKSINKKPVFGYFGDYYSITRNLKPFYESLLHTNSNAYIYGDTDLALNETENILISGRVTLDKLKIAQDNTDVLVHLSNLKGGQIPGKIYHYSATNKPILFILDGTDDEKKLIYEYFSKFNRYYFCNNNEQDISRAIELILKEGIDKRYDSVIEFSPKEVVKKIINLGGE